MNERLNLVTGATGFAASHVIKLLLSQGQQVVGTDLESALRDPVRRQVAEQIGLDLDHPDLDLCPADLLDPASLASLLQRPITHIFHTASLYDYSAPLDRLRRINVMGTQNLLEQVRNKSLRRFIHWSTCGIFGKPYPASCSRGRSNLPFSERSSSPRNTPPDAKGPVGTHLVNAYSVSKWEQEKQVWEAHRQGLPITVIRPAPIYGPGSRYGHGGIILGIARGLLPLLPRDARNYITTSVHVEDVARFACFIAEQDDALGEDYNLADNSIISYSEFLRYIALLLGRRMWEVPFIYLSAVRLCALPLARLWAWMERHLGVPRWRMVEVQSATYIGSSYWISNRKSLATGFQYRYLDVREGLKDTVAWMHEEGWL